MTEGWTTCTFGHRHWGRAGAAGLLLTRTTPGTGREVLLQHRAPWTHEGGTWGVAGGARHRDESPLQTALREAREEVGIVPDALRATGIALDDHGGWAYRTVVADALVADPTDLGSAVAGHETSAVAWVAVDEVVALPLHPGFAASWSSLRGMLAGVVVVVDAANVVGSTPDGWWRDRTGATARLVALLRTLAEAGLPAGQVPGHAAGPRRPGIAERCLPLVEVVVEGAVARSWPHDAVRQERLSVLPAPGSGDDLVVARAQELTAAGRGVLAVTADRALAERVRATGAGVVGPRWVRDTVARYGA